MNKMFTLGRWQVMRSFRWQWGIVEGPFDYHMRTTTYTDYYCGPVVIRRYAK